MAGSPGAPRLRLPPLDISRAKSSPPRPPLCATSQQEQQYTAPDVCASAPSPSKGMTNKKAFHVERGRRGFTARWGPTPRAEGAPTRASGRPLPDVNPYAPPPPSLPPPAPPDHSRPNKLRSQKSGGGSRPWLHTEQPPRWAGAFRFIWAVTAGRGHPLLSFRARLEPSPSLVPGGARRTSTSVSAPQATPRSSLVPPFFHGSFK
ncbi:unnamed protein product [Gadus morhua 'NCC']